MPKPSRRDVLRRIAGAGVAAGILGAASVEAAAKGNDQPASEREAQDTPADLRREADEIGKIIREDLQAARDAGDKERERQILRDLEPRLKRLQEKLGK